jgi:redox-sensitive bicupin YhaK (pirin superfamily)
MASIIRELTKIHAPSLQREAGFIMIRRTVGGHAGEVGNLFLLLDHADCSVPANVKLPGNMHPHRGFETLSYNLQGEHDLNL